MHKKPTHATAAQQQRKYGRKIIQQAQPRAICLDQKLLSNPFLKDKHQFLQLSQLLKEYNQRVKNQNVKDSYEIASYESLHSMLSDLVQLQTQENQIERLLEVKKWFTEQQRLILQRKQQGNVRYIISLQFNYLKLPESQVPSTELQDQSQLIPSELVDQLMKPYREGWRTMHIQISMPEKRLPEYKRKALNFGSFDDHKPEIKPPRVLYPRPQKIQIIKDEQHEEEARQGPIQVPEELIPEGEKPQDQKMQEDIGMAMGEQPEEPDEQEEVQDRVEDKLAPKNKIYKDAVQGTMLIKKPEIKIDKEMQQRYLKGQQSLIMKQREDMRNIELSKAWGESKAKTNKQLQKKLQHRTFKPKYNFSVQEESTKQFLTPQQELKYGFSMALRRQPKIGNIVDAEPYLPRLKAKRASFDQKLIRKDRLNSLMGKYGKLLNLSEYQQKQIAPSLCQYTSRKRGISEILKQHSQSKERLKQFTELQKISEKLSSRRVALNFRRLSAGLCLPENQQVDELTINTARNLPSNPFMVQTKKKKKR